MRRPVCSPLLLAHGLAGRLGRAGFWRGTTSGVIHLLLAVGTVLLVRWWALRA